MATIGGIERENIIYLRPLDADINFLLLLETPRSIVGSPISTLYRAVAVLDLAIFVIKTISIYKGPLLCNGGSHAFDPPSKNHLLAPLSNLASPFQKTMSSFKVCPYCKNTVDMSKGHHARACTKDLRIKLPNGETAFSREVFQDNMLQFQCFCNTPKAEDCQQTYTTRTALQHHLKVLKDRGVQFTWSETQHVRIQYL
jgi:uncharacterized Zn-finger protein